MNCIYRLIMIMNMILSTRFCINEYIGKSEQTSSWRTNSSFEVSVGPYESSSPSCTPFNERITHRDLYHRASV